MSSIIRLSMTPEALRLRPDGGPIEAAITVCNETSFVDHYALEIDGLPADWYMLSSSQVALFPGDTEEARLILHPPVPADVAAGNYPFSIVARSQADPTLSARIEASLRVDEVAGLMVSLSPRKASGRRGRYTLTVHNTGNAATEVALDATDDEEECRYRFGSRDLYLEAGEQREVRLTVRPRRSGLVGVEKPYAFQVQALPIDGEAAAIHGELVHTPRLRSLRGPRRLAVLGVLAGLLLASVSALGGPQGVRAYSCQHAPVLCALTATPTPTPVAPTGGQGAGGARGTQGNAAAQTPVPGTTTAGKGGHATATPTATATMPPVRATATAVAMATAGIPMPTATPVPAATSTPIPVATSTPTPIATNTPIPTPTPTSTPVPAPTSTPTATPTATDTPTPTATATATPTTTATATATATTTPITAASDAQQGAGDADNQQAAGLTDTTQPATPTPQSPATPTPSATPTSATTSIQN